MAHMKKAPWSGWEKKNRSKQESGFLMLIHFRINDLPGNSKKRMFAFTENRTFIGISDIQIVLPKQNIIEYKTTNTLPLCPIFMICPHKD